MRNRFRELLIAGATVLSLASMPPGQGIADDGDRTADQAKAMLAKAIDAVKADKAKALDQFNKGEGGFRDGNLYVFCINAGDFKFVAVGNPNAKQILGVDARTIKDVNGDGLNLQLANEKP